MSDSLSRVDVDGGRSLSQSTTNPATSSVDEKLDYDASSLQKAESGLKDRFPHINERKMLWKMDLRIVGLVFIMNFFTFLDRVNISNAALFGLKQDLKLVGNQYNTILTIYFIPYILCDIPANILLKKVRPHIWLPLCTFGFGFVTIMEGLTHNFGGMLTARFFLGMFECAIFPGCIYYISMWYTRAEAQTRFTLFFSSNTLAGSFAGLLGYAIGHMDGMRGFHGWRWIFILEGTLSCVVALCFFFLVSDFPEEATWLSAEEKAYVKARLQEDAGVSGRSEGISRTHFVHLFKEYKTYLGALMYFGLIVPAYSFAYFAPSIIQGYGHSAITTQLLSIPPYACAFVFSMTISAISDRLQHRFAFTMLGTTIGIIGFAILFNVHNNTNTQYAALFLAATGTYTAMPLALCWFGMNVQGHAQRSLATGFQIGFGNSGGIIASYSFLANQAPKYLTGYTICISFACLSALATCLYSLAIRAEKAKAKELTDSEASDSSTDFKFSLTT